MTVVYAMLAGAAGALIVLILVTFSAVRMGPKLIKKAMLGPPRKKPSVSMSIPSFDPVAAARDDAERVAR